MIVSNMTLMNTQLEVSIPGFMKIEYDQIRKEQKIGGGGCAAIYKGVILDNSLKQVFFFSLFLILFLFSFFNYENKITKWKIKIKNKKEIWMWRSGIERNIWR